MREWQGVYPAPGGGDGMTLSSIRAWIRRDLSRGRYLPFGVVALLITTVVVVAYYIHHPDVLISPDTDSFLQSARRIMHSGQPVDAGRTPGYPLFMALVFFASGEDNMQALSIAQGCLFVLAVMEIYVLVAIMTRRAWIAASIAILVGTNTFLISYAKADIVEGFALWVVISLALAAILFVERPSVARLWIVAGLGLFASMTRPEWLYVVVPLVGLLIVTARGRTPLRTTVIHGVAAIVAVYAITGAYVAANVIVNDYPGITFVQRINLFGKVIQYRMQDHAPTRYAGTTRALDAYLRTAKDPGPYEFAARYPQIGANHWQLAGEYAAATVRNAPVEFVRKSATVFFNSNYYWSLTPIDPAGRFGRPLSRVERLSANVQDQYGHFPLVAAGWIVIWLVLLVRRTSWLSVRVVEMMVVLCLLGLYDLTMISVGGYTDYPRLQIPVDPVRIIVIFGTLALAAAVAVEIGFAGGRRVASREGSPSAARQESNER